MKETYDRYWRIRTRLPERFGQRCRLVIRAGKLNSALVEFEDKTRVVTGQHAFRKIKT